MVFSYDTAFGRGGQGTKKAPSDSRCRLPDDARTAIGDGDFSKKNYLLTLSFRALPALKTGALEASMLICSPVRGLRATRAGRLRTLRGVPHDAVGRAPGRDLAAYGEVVDRR